MPVRHPARIVPRRVATAFLSLAVLAAAIGRAGAVPLPGESGSSPGLSAEVAPGHLVVSEVMTGGASASDEFIELYNPTGEALPLDGLEVIYVTASGATVTRKAAWSTGAVGVAPGGHVLVANEAGVFAGLADVTYANGLAATGGSVAVREIGDASAIDAVGWGAAASTWLERRPAPAPPAGSSLERLPGGASGSTQDSDDNLVDFAVQPLPDPQNSTSAPVPAPSDSPSATPSPATSDTPGVSPTATPGVTDQPTATPSEVPSETGGATPSASATATPSAMPTPTPIPAPVSIAVARALPDGSQVTVEGVTPTASDFSEGGGYLADGSGGIAVLLSDGTFARGVLLRVSGTLDDRFAQRTIRSDATGISGSDPAVEPVPVEVATVEVGEAFEGTLVRISGTITSSATVLTSGLAFDVDDGSGPIRVLVGGATGIDTAAWQRDVELTVVGVVGQRDSSGSGTAGFRLQPRDPADVLALLPAPTPTPTPKPIPSATASPSPAASGTPVPTSTPSGAPLVTIAEARAAEVGTRVRVRGVVTAPSGLLATGSAVVQDATGGILVRLGDEAGSLALGQLVELDGTRSTKAGMLSLRVTRPAMVLGSQGDPDPLRRATGALGESEEALLVIARGLVSSAVSRLGGGGISFTIDDGSGALRVTISADAAIAATSVQRGAWLELRGVLGQETTGKEPLRGYRLWPRTAADLRVIATPGSAAGAVCCTSADHPTGQVATGAASQAALAPSSVPGRQPVLSRPQPTTEPAGVTAGVDPATGPVARPPRGAGLVVSGLGLAAMAALLAWFSRRRGPDGLPDQGGVGAPAVEAEPSDGLPRLSLLRAGVEDPSEVRRILPPT